ncbi:hypothetical protein H2201_003547 [Coniosporium apollinis]|uniref:HAT C-terminal dimerisation domain-containing protein n=1 Tax=Coniosporium apollinis TaxID=61459 RepID=A0ABQ9NVD5_9PEZI|nr:hypothetical protein H2201_003547 [Coniosporium apollinis]
MRNKAKSLHYLTLTYTAADLYAVNFFVEATYGKHTKSTEALEKILNDEAKTHLLIKPRHLKAKVAKFSSALEFVEQNDPIKNWWEGKMAI